MTSRRCTAASADGSPCRAWAARGTDPPRCNAHRTDADWGAPEGNTNALKHGYYAACPAGPDHGGGNQQPALSSSKGGANVPEHCSIEAIIGMLYHKQVALDDYIDHILATGSHSIQELIHLLRIHGQNASRLGRLLRDRRALSDEPSDALSAAIAQALDELSSELGTDLT
jgi:hypothetical protein